MNNYEELLRKCFDEINAVQNASVIDDIEQDTKSIMECFENAKQEMYQMINEQKISNIVYDRCNLIFSKQVNIIQEKVQHIKSRKMSTCNWYVGLNDGIIKSESKDTYRDNCIKEIRCQLFYAAAILFIVLLAAFGVSYLVLQDCFTLLEQPQEEFIQLSLNNLFYKKTMGLFGYYFKIFLLMIIQIIIIVTSYKVVPKMYNQARQLFTLLTMVKTSANTSLTNIQRELELIMKS